jgi:ornithine cyclodeaminase
VQLLCRVRDFERVSLVGRRRERVESLAAKLREDEATSRLRIDIDVAPDDAAAAADVIATVTSATEPVFDGRKVRPGVHINIAGAFRPDWREIDDAVAGRAVFYLDSMHACLERAGDIRIPLESGVLSRDRIRGEIGSLFAGDIPGRTNPEEITVFKSLGNAVQDLHLAGKLLADSGPAGTIFQLEI